MSDETQGAIELSEEELDVVAGGLSFKSFNGTFFEQTDSLIMQNTESRPDGSSSTTSVIATRSIRTFAISSLFFGGRSGRRRC